MKATIVNYLAKIYVQEIAKIMVNASEESASALARKEETFVNIQLDCHSSMFLLSLHNQRTNHGITTHCHSLRTGAEAQKLYSK